VNYPLTALISDLHANQPALETALSDARERGAERFVCLGDVIGYGARPRECLDWVMSLCGETPRDPGAANGSHALQPGLCLLGNHEHALLHSAEDFNPKARAAIEWTREELNRGEQRDQNYGYWEFLDRLAPAESDELAMFAHGSPRDPVREYMLPRDIQNREKMVANFARMARNVSFVGHSHVPAIYYEDGRLFRPRGSEGPYALDVSPTNRAIVNVGSVGQPRDGDPRLSYVMFDGLHVTFVRLEYDHAAAAAAIRSVPELPEFLAERLALGK
jgi:diadenosine tetraphosphatase ApaH/serine/threonine PP2A family protein phosphatase